MLSQKRKKRINVFYLADDPTWQKKILSMNDNQNQETDLELTPLIT